MQSQVSHRFEELSGKSGLSGKARLGKGEVAQGKVCVWDSSHGVTTCWKWRYPPDGGFPRYSEHSLVGGTGWRIASKETVTQRPSLPQM